MMLKNRKEALVEALSDTESAVREAAAAALEKLESLQGLEAISRVLKTGSRDQQIRAIYALEQVVSPKAFSPLVAALSAKEADVRGAALQVLGKKKNVKVLKYMVRHLKDPDPAVRVHAAEALGNFSDRRLTPSRERSAGSA
jgi:HEAT repeat protein